MKKEAEAKSVLVKQLHAQLGRKIERVEELVCALLGGLLCGLRRDVNEHKRC